jgi:mRNA interferase MazF
VFVPSWTSRRTSSLRLLHAGFSNEQSGDPQVIALELISQGEVWWADLPYPEGSGPGFRRPVVIVQCDALNRSRIATVVCVPLTSNLRRTSAPGNVALAARLTGLSKESVANVSQILTMDKEILMERVGKIPPSKLHLILSGIDVILGR